MVTLRHIQHLVISMVANLERFASDFQKNSVEYITWYTMRDMQQVSFKTTLKKLPDNSRFYILVASFLISVLVVSEARISYPTDTLFVIRSEQIFGFLSLAYLYIALIITPVSKLLTKRPWLEKLEFTRRAIGVSAAYFALMHMVIAEWGQLGGLGQLKFLPPRFKWSLGLGLVAVAILTMMALISFDNAIRLLSFRWWKFLQRFGYLAGVTALIHVWLIASHLSSLIVTYGLFMLLNVLFGLEALRTMKAIHKKTGNATRAVLIALALWLGLSGGLLVLIGRTRNYHTVSRGGVYGH